MDCFQINMHTSIENKVLRDLCGTEPFQHKVLFHLQPIYYEKRADQRIYEKHLAHVKLQVRGIQLGIDDIKKSVDDA
jgi:hypothetical protein